MNCLTDPDSRTDDLSVWTTGEPDEATSVLANVYAPHQLTVRDKENFAFSFHALRSRELTVGLNRFATDIHIKVPPPSLFYTLCYAPVGEVETISGSSTMVASPAAATILHPDATWHFNHWRPGSSLLCVRIDRAMLEDELTMLTGRPVTEPVEFAGPLDLREDVGQDLARIMQTLWSPDGRPSAIAAMHPLVADRTAQLLRSTLLVGCRHNYSELLESEHTRAGAPQAVRLVLDAIEEDPMQVLSATDAARIAHMSIRAVEKAFARHIGVSPVRFSRQVRLARARTDLVSGDPEVETVMSVARRWGFGHAGRFASLYTERYGEMPSVTLKH